MKGYQCKMKGDDVFDDWVFDDANGEEKAVLSFVVDHEMEISGQVHVKHTTTKVKHTYFVEVVKYPDIYKATLIRKEQP